MPNKLIKTLIPLTILLIPAYLIRFAFLGIPTNVLEALILVTFLAHLAKRSPTFTDFYKKNKLIVLGVVFIFMGLLISTFVSNEWRTGFGIVKSWFVVPLMFSWVLYAETKNEQNLKHVIGWLYWGIFGVAIISLGYYLAGNLTYDGRLAGIYNSPNFLAMYLTPGIILGLFQVKMQNAKCKMQNYPIKSLRDSGASNSKCKIITIIYLISLLVIVAVLYLTYSYAAWLAVILSLIIVYLIKNRKINKRVVLASLIVVLIIFTSQWNTEKAGNLKVFSRSSLESRIMIWRAAGKIISDNPVWGIGPGNFQNKYLEYQKYYPPYLEWAVPQPHNVYLAFWLQTGLFGLMGFLVIVAVWLKQMLELNAKKNSQLAMTLIAIMACILLHGLLDTTYWKNDLALIFWMVVFLGLKARELPKKTLDQKL